jgi:hypothetical protein
MHSKSVRKSHFDLEHWLRHSSVFRLIASWLLTWNEGRYTTQTSRELLAIYRSIFSAHPKLANRELYKRVVIAHKGCDETVAKRILESAEESFAAWPVRRELTFCDVVHYLAMTEFLTLHDGEHWIYSDLRYKVSSRIPHELCIMKKKLSPSLSEYH